MFDRDVGQDRAEAVDVLRVRKKPSRSWHPLDPDALEPLRVV